MLYLIFIRIVGWLAQSSTRTSWTTSEPDERRYRLHDPLRSLRDADPIACRKSVPPDRARIRLCFGAPASPSDLPAIFSLVFADWRTVRVC